MEEDEPSMTAGVSSGRLESELENVCRELGLVNAKISELQETKDSLLRRRDQLSVEIQARKKRREFVRHPSEVKIGILAMLCCSFETKKVACNNAKFQISNGRLQYHERLSTIILPPVAVHTHLICIAQSVRPWNAMLTSLACMGLR